MLPAGTSQRGSARTPMPSGWLLHSPDGYQGLSPAAPASPGGFWDAERPRGCFPARCGAVGGDGGGGASPEWPRGEMKRGNPRALPLDGVRGMGGAGHSCERPRGPRRAMGFAVSLLALVFLCQRVSRVPSQPHCAPAFALQNTPEFGTGTAAAKRPVASAAPLCSPSRLHEDLHT